MADLPWLWIPITIGAAFAQTRRNAAQRHLTSGRDRASGACPHARPVEMLFSYAISRTIFREHLGWRERASIVLLTLGTVGVAALR